MRTTAELREGFLRFYEERGHLRVPSHSLIPPADDPSTLFIVAGMQQFKPYFLGLREPPGKRVVSVQKVLRAGGKDTDLEDVGRTDRHCSFFEMLGNFSFGDYFKDEAVDMAWEFVTKHMGLDPDKLWATVHEGNPVLELGEDTVAIEAWKRVGMPADRIVRLGKDNFWQAADTGPCGPCSEIFLDRGEEHGCGRDDCRPGCECDRYMEFYNLVFMEFDLRPGPELVPLPNQNVDTGLGVERGACLLQEVGSVFDTDGFRLIMDWVETESGAAYGDEPGRDQGPPRARRPRPRDVVPDRRRRHAVERGPRLHLPPDHPPRRPARPADRARPRLPARRCRRASRWATPTRSCASTQPRSRTSSGSRRSASARRSRAARRSSTSSPAWMRSPRATRSSSRRPTGSRSS